VSKKRQNGVSEQLDGLIVGFPPIRVYQSNVCCGIVVRATGILKALRLPNPCAIGSELNAATAK